MSPGFAFWCAVTLIIVFIIALAQKGLWAWAVLGLALLVALVGYGAAGFFAKEGRRFRRQRHEKVLPRNPPSTWTRRGSTLYPRRYQ